MEGLSKVTSQQEITKITRDLLEKKPEIDDLRPQKGAQLKDVAGEAYTAGTVSSYSQGQLAESIAATNKIIVGQNAKFEYSIHEKTGRIMVRLVDLETEEVVKEIPPEKFLDSVANIWEMSGLLVNRKG